MLMALAIKEKSAVIRVGFQIASVNGRTIAPINRTLIHIATQAGACVATASLNVILFPFELITGPGEL